jgi:hypothetical protein
MFVEGVVELEEFRTCGIPAHVVDVGERVLARFGGCDGIIEGSFDVFHDGRSCEEVRV